MKALSFALVFAWSTLVQAGPCTPGNAVSRPAAAPKKKLVLAKPGLQPDGNRIVGRAELERSHTVADALRHYPEIYISR